MKKRETMINKLYKLSLCTILITLGCTPTSTNINGTYKSDIEYYESLIRSNPDITDNFVERMKPLQPKLFIDYPECTFINYNSSNRGGSTNITENPMTGSIEKINNELYLFIKTNSDGSKFKSPIYFDQGDGSLYTSSKKFIKEN